MLLIPPALPLGVGATAGVEIAGTGVAGPGEVGTGDGVEETAGVGVGARDGAGAGCEEAAEVGPACLATATDAKLASMSVPMAGRLWAKPRDTVLNLPSGFVSSIDIAGELLPRLSLHCNISIPCCRHA